MCKLDLVKLRSAQKVPRFDIRHPFEVTKVVLKEFSSWQKCSSCLEMAWMQHYTSVFYLVWGKQSLPLHPTPTHLKGKKKTTDKNLIGVQKSRHLARTFISWKLAVLEKRHSFCYKCSRLKVFLKWTNKTTIYKWTDLFAANQHSCYGVAFILGVRTLTGLYQIRSTFLTFGKPSQMTESDKID